MWNFNPRSPHGERLLEQTREIKVTAISIHAPRTGSDRYAIEDILRLQISIHAPRTGSDQHIAHILAILVISIHAPRTGSDRFA